MDETGRIWTVSIVRLDEDRPRADAAGGFVLDPLLRALEFVGPRDAPRALEWF